MATRFRKKVLIANWNALVKSCVFVYLFSL